MKANVINGSHLISGTVVFPMHAKERVVLVGGCFDIVHLGHITFLNKAKTKGTYLVVAVENDDFIRKNKKVEPFHSQTQRAEVLLNIRSVDAVITLPTMKSDEDYFILVQKIRPSVIAVTEGDPHLTQKRAYAKSVRGKLQVVSGLRKGLSSSTIRTYAHIMRD